MRACMRETSFFYQAVLPVPNLILTLSVQYPMSYNACRVIKTTYFFLLFRFVEMNDRVSDILRLTARSCTMHWFVATHIWRQKSESHFLSNAPRFPKEHCCVEFSYASPDFASGKRNVQIKVSTITMHISSVYVGVCTVPTIVNT
jgi:hypothetical protein